MPPTITAGLVDKSRPVTKMETGVGWPPVMALKGPRCHIVPWSMAPSPIPIPLTAKMPGPAGPILIVPVSCPRPVETATFAMPAPIPAGTTKLIWPGETYCIIAATPFTATEQPPRLVGKGGVAAACCEHKLLPKMLANEPGARGWPAANEAPLTILI